MSDELKDTVERALAARRADDLDGYIATLAPDFVEVYPQSRERLVGPDRVRRLLIEHPDRPRLLGSPRWTQLSDTAGVVEERTTYGSETWWAITILEGRGGRLTRERAYFARPLERAAWRARWVEPIPAVVPAPDTGGHRAVERDVAERYVRAFAENDDEVLRHMRHAGWVHDMPQSGERFPTSRAYLEAHAAYPGGLPSWTPVELTGPEDQWLVGASAQPMRVSGRGAHWVGETQLTYPNGDRWFDVLFLDFRDGQVVAERSYWCDPFERPAWRAELSELM